MFVFVYLCMCVCVYLCCDVGFGNCVVFSCKVNEYVLCVVCFDCVILCFMVLLWDIVLI